MDAIPPPKLIGGPYRAPDCRKGHWLMDEITGMTEVGGLTATPIPWPRRKKTGRAALLLTGDLIKAVRVESVTAICYWWGVGPTTVAMWRNVLGTGRLTEGTRQLLRENTGVPPEAAARGRKVAAQPEARAKASMTMRNRPRRTRAALLANAKAPKPPGWGTEANTRMMAAR